VNAAVKLPRQPNFAALLVSVGLHAAFLLLPLVGALRPTRPEPRPALPNSVAMLGSSIEIEAPTPELAASPASPAADIEPPVDVNALPIEPAVAPPTPPAAHTPDPSPAATALPKANPAAPRAAPRKPAAKPRVAQPPSTPAAGSDASSTGAPAAGTFGQEGLAPGVRRLGYAFTRAIPAATPADSAWRDLPAGRVGTIRIELEIDDANRLGALKRWQARPGEPAPPAVLERMVERTLLLLRAGQFALSGSNQPGTERLIIDVQLRDEAPEEEPVTDVVQKKFDGASPGHPGKAYFRDGTGRACEAKVTVVSSGK
jgi:hypothetical protein